MASSSTKDFSQILAPTTSFEDLYDELKAKIAARVAASSLQDFRSLISVSKSFNTLSNHASILSGASLDISKLRWNKYPWSTNPTNRRFRDNYDGYERYVLDCEKAGNPLALETLFHNGFRLFFEGRLEYDDDFHGRALALMDYAYGKGLEAATEWYGVTLIASGGPENTKKGFTILRPYVISLTPAEVVEMERRWTSRQRMFEWTLRDSQIVFFFRTTYERNECDCDGMTEQWFATPEFPWLRFLEFEGMPTTSACEVCLWHVIITRLFRLDFEN